MKERWYTLCGLIFLFFIFPILLMMNCAGNEAYGVTSCFIDVPILGELAEMLFFGVLMSAFLGFIPIVLYIVIAIFIIIRVDKKLKKSN